jgi:tRNA (cmo5U34)-methyltransferase
MSDRDTLYREQKAEAGSFRFDERVAAVFPDMIGRSVPGYGLIVPMIGQLARRYARDGTVLHDLGCSLGAVTFAMRRALAKRDLRFVATDRSAAMLERCRELMGEEPPGPPVDWVLGDILDTDFTSTSVAVLNFTLQFVPETQRQDLLGRIASALVPGGVLVLSEKIRFEDAATQQRQTDWHHDYKRLQGYSDLEIARKRTALERVLIPESEHRHVTRLQAAGFRRVTRWFQCFAFCSYLAEK